MSVNPQPHRPGPEPAAYVARATFPKGILPDPARPPGCLLRGQALRGDDATDVRCSARFWPQVCCTASTPISVPRCFGSEATARRGFATARMSKS